MAHRLRSSILAGDGAASLAPAPTAEPCRRSGAAAPAAERRSAAQRKAERHRGLVERAAITVRGKTALVPVLNSSKGGVTVETSLQPEIGEAVGLALAGSAPAAAMVRWVRRGRIGLALADGYSGLS
jgi:hypothetical protein